IPQIDGSIKCVHIDVDDFANGHLPIILFLFSRLVRTQRRADKRIWAVKIGMKKKRGNPNWGKPDLDSTARIQANSFEEIVRKLRLSPEQYVNSVQLKGNNHHKIRAIRLVEGLGFRSCQRLLKIIQPYLLMR